MVSNTATCKLVPIDRPTDILSPVIARWHGRVSVTGDLSGGAANCILSLPNVADQFNRHALCKINGFCVNRSLAAGATLFNFRVSTEEQSSGGDQLLYWFTGSLAAGQNNSGTMPDITRSLLFRPVAGMGYNPALLLDWITNINTEAFYFAAWGFIVDERYITVY